MNYQHHTKYLEPTFYTLLGFYSLLGVAVKLNAHSTATILLLYTVQKTSTRVPYCYRVYRRVILVSIKVLHKTALTDHLEDASADERKVLKCQK
jgi:hypothetical protein